MTHDQIATLNEMFQRVAAWRDNAHLMLIHALPEDEARWRNEYDNYSALCGQMIAMMQPELKITESIANNGFRTWQ